MKYLKQGLSISQLINQYFLQLESAHEAQE